MEHNSVLEISVTVNVGVLTSETSYTMAAPRLSVHVRPARPEDYEAVVSLVPDLWGGVDYLPLKYFSYFSDPQAHPFVGEVDGKVVCFTSYYVVDSGLTAVATGGRTLAQYQGRGISAKVKAASLEAAKVNFPDLRTEALTAIDAPFYDRYRTPNPQGVYISYERWYLQYLTTTQQLVHLLNSLQDTHPAKPTGGPRQLTHRADLDALPDRLLSSRLFPEGTILIYNGYLPLKVTRENLVLACETTTVVASSDGSGQQCTGVSFGTCLQVKRGPSLVFFFHVTSLHDLLQHLKLQLHHHRHHLEPNKGNANLELSFPMGLSKEEVKRHVFPSVGANAITEDIPRETVLCAVRPLTRAKSKL